MKALKPYQIAFVGLSTGVHEFDFDIGDDFFECFDHPDILTANLKGKLILDKKSNMLDLRIVVEGKVELTCDRCLDTYFQDVVVDKELFVKFGQQRDEQGDEIIVVPFTESHIEVSQYFYEFIILSLPIRHVHPGGENKEDNCDEQALKDLQKYMVSPDAKTESDASEDKPSDARWDALKNIKFNGQH